ncbi:MAG: class I SAM-dependent methyltransferase [Candidatus Omnitrophica bacterium]|nr:class I SAM-dependent methyltransferase [Candidatus Omnitrophota bacterium]
MIEIIEGKLRGEFLSKEEYYRGKSLLAKMIMPITKRLRTNQVSKFLVAGKNHLDIGCGDGFLMKRSPCQKIYGIDSKYGDTFYDHLNFPDAYFDFVSMLAVLEHLKNPQIAFKEIHRILNANGKFIFTTPTKQSETIIRLYVPTIKNDHHHYYNLKKIKHLSQGLFKITHHHKFFFGLNQFFCLEKIMV